MSHSLDHKLSEVPRLAKNSSSTLPLNKRAQTSRKRAGISRQGLCVPFHLPMSENSACSRGIHSKLDVSNLVPLPANRRLAGGD